LPATLKPVLVNQSGTVPGVWDGTRGGTGAILRYAERMGRQIILISLLCVNVR